MITRRHLEVASWCGLGTGFSLFVGGYNAVDGGGWPVRVGLDMFGYSLMALLILTFIDLGVRLKRWFLPVVLFLMLSAASDAGWRGQQRFQARMVVKPQLLVINAQKREHVWGTIENGTSIVAHVLSPLSWFMPLFR